MKTWCKKNHRKKRKTLVAMKKRYAKTISLFDLMEKHPAQEESIKYLEKLRRGM